MLDNPLHIMLQLKECIFLDKSPSNFKFLDFPCLSEQPQIAAFFAAANKMFILALPRQCFCRGWQDFILRASAFTWATSAKTSTRSKLVRLLDLLHISPRIRSIMCKIQFKILTDHQYTFKIRRHPLFVAAYLMIITIHFTYMKNDRFTLQSSLPNVGLCFFKLRGCFNSSH